MELASQYAFEQIVKTHLKRAGLSQATAARQLHYTPEQFNKWIRGVNRMPDVAILALAELLKLTDEERTELFTLAGYVAVTALNQSNQPDEETAHQNPGPPPHHLAARPSSLGKLFSEALQAWSNNFFRWSEAPAHMRSSWAGLLLYSLTAINDRLTPRGLLIFCVSLLLGIVTAQLMMPMLLWPLAEPGARQSAYLKYGLATWLIPLLVSFVTPPDQPSLFQLTTLKRRLTFWFLKFTGALVGFWVFAALCFGLALGLYYLHLPPLAAPFRAGLALVPLFFSYVTARRIPMDRYQMFKGQLRPHPADWFFLAIFMVIGPLTALFFYAVYGFLADRSISPVVILLALTGLAVWHARKQKQQPVSDAEAEALDDRR